jgi:hypothetical protein
MAGVKMEIKKRRKKKAVGAHRVVRGDAFFIVVVLRSGKSDPSGSAAQNKTVNIFLKKKTEATK